MKKIKIIVAGLFMAVIVAVNISIVGNFTGNQSWLDLNALNLAFAGSGESEDCQPACSPGYACVNGVCIQREAATRTSCTAYVWCWVELKYIPTPGHQTKCPPNPGGITNCSGTKCIADTDPC